MLLPLSAAHQGCVVQSNSTAVHQKAQRTGEHGEEGCGAREGGLARVPGDRRSDKLLCAYAYARMHVHTDQLTLHVYVRSHACCHTHTLAHVKVGSGGVRLVLHTTLSVATTWMPDCLLKIYRCYQPE